MSLLLAIDTVTRFCSCGLYQQGMCLAHSCDDIGKGHGEHLIDQIDSLLHQVGVEKSALGRIGVNIGPGTFTGMRIGVAVARALALALGIDAVGISRFEAIHHGMRQMDGKGRGGDCAVILAAVQDKFSVQIFADTGQPLCSPYQAAAADVIARLPQPVMIAAAVSEDIHSFLQDNSLVDYEFFAISPEAELDALAALSAASTSHLPPSPLYLRPPDAKLAVSSMLPVT